MSTKASDIFFRLMEAAQDGGIGQCKRHIWLDSRGVETSAQEAKEVCTVGLLCWGPVMGISTPVESCHLFDLLGGSMKIVELNDDLGWTFPDFYEYLKDKEAKEIESQPVEIHVRG